jgi:uncharacterized membrane protein
MRRIRVAGHPLHPALVHLPLGLLVAVPILQLVGRFGPAPIWGEGARAALELGLLASVPAALAGVLDLFSMRAGDKAMMVAILHLSAMVAAVGCYALAWWVWDRPHTAFGLAVAGAALLVAGGYAGGKLVYTHNVATHAEPE